MTPEQTGSDLNAVENLNTAYDKIKSEIAKVIVGQDKVVEQLLISLLASGHCLLVGVPGLAKTLLISTLANVLNLKFNRIQFTPHARPDAVRYHRYRHHRGRPQHRQAAVPICQGSGLRQYHLS
jgi:MoxR-like ATPase